MVRAGQEDYFVALPAACFAARQVAILVRRFDTSKASAIKNATAKATVTPP